MSHCQEERGVRGDTPGASTAEQAAAAKFAELKLV